LVSGRFAIPGRFETTITIHDRFRSRHAITVAPAPGTTRIAVLGDSATFGWGSEDAETYPSVLEQLMNARENGVARAPVEVLNAGVIGTGTGEQALWYDFWVKQFAPAVVVLTVYWNDVDDDAVGSFFEVDARDGSIHPRPVDVLERAAADVRRTRRITRAIPGFEWLSQYSQLMMWARQAPYTMFVSARLRTIGADAASADGRSALTAAQLSLFRGEIRWLREQVRPGRLDVVFLPSAEAFDASRSDHDKVVSRSAQIVSALKAMAADEATPFLDGLTVMAAQPDVGRLYFARDPHPNPAGNRVFAGAVAAFLGKLP
jgi:lysophospholipase L1-like esterase